MSYFLVQFLSALGGQALAARDSDSEDTRWMQTLFFIILALFYVVGSILKSRAGKPEKQKSQQKPGRKPPETAPELPEFISRLLYPQQERSGKRPVERAPKGRPHPTVRPPRRKVTRPAPARRGFAETRPYPAGRKVYTETEKPISLSTLESSGVSELSLLGPQLRPQVGEAPAGITVEVPQPEHLTELLSDYEDPEKLRRAILHYEILGKPLSLRDPSEHIIGL